MKDKVTIYMDDGTPVDVDYDELVRMFIKMIDGMFDTCSSTCTNCKCKSEANDGT